MKSNCGSHRTLTFEKGSDPAPRLHPFDDTGEPTGEIYVGYQGRQLSNFQTA